MICCYDDIHCVNDANEDFCMLYGDFPHNDDDDDDDYDNMLL